jgi:hypothetical protein
MAQHPELQPEPLELTDEKVYDALLVAVREWTACFESQGWEVRGTALARCVTCVLRGVSVRGDRTGAVPPSKSDVLRVAAVLSRLERGGRVRNVRRRWESAGRWTPAA